MAGRALPHARELGAAPARVQGPAAVRFGARRGCAPGAARSGSGLWLEVARCALEGRSGRSERDLVELAERDDRGLLVLVGPHRLGLVRLRRLVFAHRSPLVVELLAVTVPVDSA